MAGAPAEVLVAVGVEFYWVRSVIVQWRMLRGRRADIQCPFSSIEYLEYSGHAAEGLWPFIVFAAQELEMVGWGGIMYRSISGEPGQGPGLVNWLAAGISDSCRPFECRDLHLLGPAMIAMELEA
jgi:hypothetical protein